ncbi:MAG TPA: exosortase/archaeosortase family protein [Cellvibrio sp.]|nr:exosortase/archaeosortase family protein [Cellvibrio sp.]
MDMASTENRQKTHRNWLLLTQLTALFLIFGVLFQSSLEPLFARWIKWDQELSHGIPTLFALLYLAFNCQKLPFRQDKQIIRWALITTLGLLSLAWLIFAIANISILANTVLFFCIIVLSAASYSLKTARFLLPLFGVLIFALPFFGQLNDILVSMSASIVGMLVHIVGITALVDGQNIFIPSGHIYIADGCSGLRYFTISILLGYLLSILNNYNAKEALLTLAIATALGLLTNWLRIFLLVLIGDMTEMKSSLMHDHEFFGWILFTCVMLPSIFLAPIRPAKYVHIESPAKLKPIAPLIALAIGPVLLAIIPNSVQSTSSFSLALLKNTNYQIETSPLEIQVPPSVKEELKQITWSGINVYAQLSEYRPNNLKEKIIPYFENIYNKEQWIKIQEQATPELKDLGFHSLILKHANKQEFITITYRFEVGGYNTDKYQTAKILQIPATFAGKRYSNFISMHSVCEDKTCESQLKAIKELALLWHQETKNLR